MARSKYPSERENWNSLTANWRGLESQMDSWKAPMNGYGCDYCSAPAVGGCYGFHACENHLNRAANDARSAHEAERCAVCGGKNPGDITHTRCSHPA